MIATILANGDFPTHDIPLDILRRSEFLCCCDGATQTALDHGFTPDAIVGDGDSLTDDMKKRYADIYHDVDEQDYNDLTKATRFCLAQGYTDIAYLGATGKREDHTLGNIFLLPYYLADVGVNPLMLTDNGSFRPAEGKTTFNSFCGQQVSIFNISSKEIRSVGLKWNSYAYNQLWQGTLNEALGGNFTIYADGLYVVFQTYDPKL